MDLAEHLRRHSRVTGQPKPLVSPGYAWRWRKSREAAEKHRARERERQRAWSNDPGNPSLSARRRAELLEQRRAGEISLPAATRRTDQPETA